VLILKVSFVVIVAELEIVIMVVFQGQEIQFNVALTEQCWNMQ